METFTPQPLIDTDHPNDLAYLLGLDTRPHDPTLVDEFGQPLDQPQYTPFQRFARNAFPEVPKALAAVEKTANSIEEMTPLLTDLIRNVTNFLSGIPQLSHMISKICDALALLYDAIIAFCKGIYHLIPSILYRALSLFNLPQTIIAHIVVKLGVYLVPRELNQAPGMHMQSVDGLASAFLSSIGMVFLLREPTTTELKDVNEKLRFTQLMSSSGKSMQETIFTLLRNLPEIVQVWAQYLMPQTWWLDLFKPGSGYYAWMCEVDELNTAEIKQRAAFDTQLQERITRLYHTGLELVQKCSIGPQFSKVFSLLQTKVKVIEDLWTIVDIASMTNTNRPVPFCVYLEGQAGKGKTFLSTVIPGILAGVYPPPPNLLYVRTPGMAHWDKYSGQFATVYDDFHATRNQNVSPGEMSEILAIVSNSLYQLPMADLKDKGQIFRSRVVVMTSNVAFPRPNELVTPVALWRRRHAMYHVDVHPEYLIPGSPEVDPNLIPDDGTNPQYVIRRFLEPANDQSPMGPPMNYTEFIADLKASYHAHVSTQQRSLVAANTMVDQASRLAMHIQGKMLDSLMFSMAASTTMRLVPTWYQDLKDLFTEPDPDWIKPMITTLSLVAAAAAMFYTGYRTMKSMMPAESTITQKVEKSAERLSMKLEGTTPDQHAQVIETALNAFRGLVPDDYLDQQIQKYQQKVLSMKPESAYSHGRITARPRPVVARAMHMEGSNDPCATQTMTHALTPALVTINNPDRGVLGVWVKGRFLLAPAHAFTDFKNDFCVPGTEIIINSYSAEYVEIFDPARLTKIGQDVVLYACSHTSRTYRDITKHFITDRDLNNRAEADASILTLRDGYPTVLQTQVRRIDVPVDVSGHPFVDGVPGMSLCNGYTAAENEGWLHNANTQNGDCGALVIVNDKSYPRKVCGIHVAGYTNQSGGMGLTVTQEMLNDGFSKLKKFEPVIIGCAPRGSYVDDIEHAKLVPQGNFTLFGTLQRTLYYSTKTKIAPSTIAGMIYPPTTAPSVLSSLDPRLEVKVSPLLNGVEKYGMRAKPIDLPLLARVTKHISELMDSLPCKVEKRLLTTHEAVNGNPDYPFVDGIPMDTSAGYPYNQRPKILRGKLDLFTETESGFTPSDPELVENTNLRRALALVGERIPSLWLDCPKDERRSLEKIRMGKTRVFTIPPLDFTIVFKEFFGMFNAHFYQNALKFFSAVGVDPESQQWTDAYQRLSAVGRIGFAGDYSNWDGNLHPEFIAGVVKIVNSWYNDSPANQLARHVLFDEIIHTPQAMLNLVYMTHIGNPSGNPMTAIMNTIIGAMYLRYCWLKLAPPEFNSLQHYEERVRDLIYGDDNIVSVEEEARSFFHPSALTVELAKLGMTYTNATKTGESSWKPLKSLTFLKRGFRNAERAMIFPTMDTNTIQELTNWIRTSDFKTDAELTLDNCNEALRFAFFHGRKYFTELRSRLAKVMPEPFRLYDYEYFYKWFFADPPSLTAPRSLQMHMQSNSFRDTANAKGIISLSQRDVADDDGAPAGNPTGSTLSRQAISDPPWSLPDMSHRRVWIGTYAWSTSQTFQNALVRLNAPLEFLADHLQVAGFERFLYWRGSMRVRIHVNGSRFHAGRLIAYFVPWTPKDIATNWQGAHMAAAWSVPNVQLDAASSNVGELNIPFYNPRSSIILNGPVNSVLDYTGSFHLTVLSPLNVSTGTSTTINVNVWVEFGEDQEFRIPIHSGTLRTPFNAEHAALLRHMSSKAHLGMHMQGNSNSSVTNISNYGEVDAMTVPVNMTGDSIGNGNSASGLPMDKPARAANPLPYYRRGFQSLAHTVGSEATTRLDLDPSQLNLSVSEMFGTEEDEMEMKFLFTRPTYAGSFAWSTTDTSGASLQARWMGPMMTFFQNASVNQVTLTQNTALTPTLWEYACLPYSFWRGGIKLRFDIVASQMHTGRLFLAFNYGASPSSEASLRDATSQYGVEIDLNNECRTFEFTIPYNAPTSWLKMCRGPQSSNRETADTWFTDYFMGSWNLRVLNVLVAPDNVASNVDIIWSVAGASDFEVYYPGPYNASFLPILNVTGEPTKERPHYQMHMQGDTGDDAAAVPTVVDSSTSDGIAVAPPGASITFPHSHFGSKAAISHLGQVIKRYNSFVTTDMVQSGVPYHAQGTVAGTDYTTGFTKNWTGSATGTSSYLLYIVIPVRPLDAGLTGHGTYRLDHSPRQLLPYYASAYRFWRGSMRYKVVWNGVLDNQGRPLDYGCTGAVFVPGTVVDDVGQPNWAARANMYMNSLDRETGGYGTVNVQDENNTSLAVDLSTEQARYNEIEIPFTVHYNVLPTVQNLPGNYVARGLLHSGYVLFVARFHVLTSDGEALETAGLSMPPRVFWAAGDDLRLGTLLGPPMLVINRGFTVGTTLYSGPSDTWTITPAALESRKPQVLDESSEDDDFVMTKSDIQFVKERRDIAKTHRQMHMQSMARLFVDVTPTEIPDWKPVPWVDSHFPTQIGLKTGPILAAMAADRQSSTPLYNRLKQTHHIRMGTGFLCMGTSQETFELLYAFDHHPEIRQDLPVDFKFYVLLASQFLALPNDFTTNDTPIRYVAISTRRIFHKLNITYTRTEAFNIMGDSTQQIRLQFPSYIGFSFRSTLYTDRFSPADKVEAYWALAGATAFRIACEKIAAAMRGAIPEFVCPLHCSPIEPYKTVYGDVLVNGVYRDGDKFNTREELRAESLLYARPSAEQRRSMHMQSKTNEVRAHPPTDEMISKFVKIAIDKVEAGITPAKTALYEVQQVVENIHLEFDHQAAVHGGVTNWTSTLKSSCSNPKWGKITKVATSTMKKAADGHASYELLADLRLRFPEASRSRAETDDSVDSRATEMTDLPHVTPAPSATVPQYVGRDQTQVDPPVEVCPEFQTQDENPRANEIRTGMADSLVVREFNPQEIISRISSAFERNDILEDLMRDGTLCIILREYSISVTSDWYASSSEPQEWHLYLSFSMYARPYIPTFTVVRSTVGGITFSVAETLVKSAFSSYFDHLMAFSGGFLSKRLSTERVHQKIGEYGTLRNTHVL